MSVEVLKQIWPEWQIEGKPLGKGSFGVVYKAVRRDHGVESYAAIKVISIPTDSSEVDSLRSEGLDMNATRTYLQGIVNDFVSEIQLMESLKGVQNIVSVEDYKVVEKTDEIGWDIYIRMELLTSFNNYICDKKLTEEEVIKLGCDICTALEICAKRNIIHRDIKPENIFINDFGYFKLGDFGIARKMENMTGGLSQKGTFNYMAPEVANGNEYDARVDTYSLGIVLYRLLNGNRLPFLDTEKQLLNPNERRNAVDRRLRGEELPVPCDASPAMADLILRACAYDPNMRFASAMEMKQALMSVANGTYKIGASNLDRTTSVRKAADSYDRTTSVRKAPVASNQKSAPAVNTFGSAPKKKSKMPVVIAAVLVVVLLVGAGIFAVPKLLDGNDSTEPNETSGTNTSETDNYSKFDEEQIDTFISEAEALAIEEDYEGALVKVQTGLATYPKSANLQEKADEYTEEINTQAKAKTLDEAKALANSGDYVSAVALIKNAQETQGDDADYQKAFNTYCSAYKKEVITTADGLAKNGDYVGALEAVGTATVVIGEDAELAAKSTEYENGYVDNVITEIDDALAERDYEKANLIIATAMKTFPSNQRLEDEKIIISNSMPRSVLVDCPPYETRGCSLATAKVGGQTYSNALVMQGGYADGLGAYAFFNLGGQYDTLEFDAGHIDGSSMNDRSVTIEIVLDGVTSQILEIDPKKLSQHYTVELKGAQQLKINQSYVFGKYAIMNAIIYPNGKKEESINLTSDTFLFSKCPPYETRGCSTKTVEIGGQTYTNAFVMQGGYADGSGAYAFFNLGGQYDTLEFDAGHIDGSSMNDQSVTIEVVLDGITSELFEIDPKELPKHYKVELKGAQQLKLLQSYAFGEYSIVNAVVY